MNSQEMSLGQKISFYRKRAKLSQLELELEIDASQGSISRIENGQVNPTKETIRKIIDVLDLNIIEAAELYELSIEDISKIIRLAGKLNSNLDMDTMLSNAANDITRDLGLSGTVIFLVEDGFLYARAVDDPPPGIPNILEVLKLKKFLLKISLSSPTSNLVVKCVNENKTIQSYKAYDWTVDVLSKKVSDFLEKISQYKSGIVFPMGYKGKVIGAVLFTKSVSEDFSREYEILEAFTENIAVSVNNAFEYSKLKQESKSI
jgi:transcriptional regulator with XRE-family HTH domain